MIVLPEFFDTHLQSFRQAMKGFFGWIAFSGFNVGQKWSGYSDLFRKLAKGKIQFIPEVADRFPQAVYGHRVLAYIC